MNVGLYEFVSAYNPSGQRNIITIAKSIILKMTILSIVKMILKIIFELITMMEWDISVKCQVVKSGVRSYKILFF